ncbi:MAG: DUF5131 family protein [Chitinophagaceae bacterium]
MNDTPHIYQVLTKRSDILLKYHKELNWTHNIWMGVSVENEKVKHRIDDLRKTNAKTKFLSCEPLIGALPNMNLKKLIGLLLAVRAEERHGIWMKIGF